MVFRAVIFDLDGTLLDTLEDIANAANSVLRRHGFPTHPVDAYRYFVGDGVGKLIERVVPEDHRHPETLKQCLATMREEYVRHLNVTAKPYEGVPELLETLHSNQIKMAVLSNKPEDFTQKCITDFFNNDLFDPVIGQREEFPRKPDPAGALFIAKTWNLPPGEILYLGDTATDMQTALAANMHPVGASWGFRTEDELRSNGAREVIARPMELVSIINSETS